jgi:hypothetical protein
LKSAGYDGQRAFRFAPQCINKLTPRHAGSRPVCLPGSTSGR